VSLRTGEGYEFENRDYIIYINQILQESGASVARKLAAFEEHWKSQEFYNHRYSLRVVCSPSLLEALPHLQQTVNAIHFQADFSHELKYFFWVITTSTEECYVIG
jgi:hypothetical protein